MYLSQILNLCTKTDLAITDETIFPTMYDGKRVYSTRDNICYVLINNGTDDQKWVDESKFYEDIPIPDITFPDEVYEKTELSLPINNFNNSYNYVLESQYFSYDIENGILKIVSNNITSSIDANIIFYAENEAGVKSDIIEVSILLKSFPIISDFTIDVVGNNLTLMKNFINCDRFTNYITTTNREKDNLIPDGSQNSVNTFNIDNTKFSLVTGEYLLDQDGNRRKIVSIEKDDLNTRLNYDAITYSNGNGSVFSILDNKLYGKGLNSHGELGLGHTDPVSNFVYLGIDVKKVACQGSATFIIDIDDRLLFSGYQGSYYLAGTDSLDDVLTFTDTGFVVKDEKIFIHYGSYFFIDSNNYPYYIGANNNGSAGLGVSGAIDNWTKIDIEATFVDTNGNSTALISTSNRLYTSGANNYMQLAIEDDDEDRDTFYDTGYDVKYAFYTSEPRLYFEDVNTGDIYWAGTDSSGGSNDLIDSGYNGPDTKAVKDTRWSMKWANLDQDGKIYESWYWTYLSLRKNGTITEFEPYSKSKSFYFYENILGTDYDGEVYLPSKISKVTFASDLILVYLENGQIYQKALNEYVSIDPDAELKKFVPVQKFYETYKVTTEDFDSEPSELYTEKSFINSTLFINDNAYPEWTGHENSSIESSGMNIIDLSKTSTTTNIAIDNRFVDLFIGTKLVDNNGNFYTVKNITKDTIDFYEDKYIFQKCQPGGFVLPGKALLTCGTHNEDKKYAFISDVVEARDGVAIYGTQRSAMTIVDKIFKFDGVYNFSKPESRYLGYLTNDKFIADYYYFDEEGTILGSSSSTTYSYHTTSEDGDYKYEFILNSKTQSRGDNYSGQLAVGDTDDRTNWTDTGHAMEKVMIGNASTFGLDSGDLYFSGNSENEWSGLGGTDENKLEWWLSYQNVIEVSTYDKAAMLLTESGNVYSTGRDLTGRTGIGTDTVTQWTEAYDGGNAIRVLAAGFGALITDNNDLYVCGAYERFSGPDCLISDSTDTFTKAYENMKHYGLTYTDNFSYVKQNDEIWINYYSEDAAFYGDRTLSRNFYSNFTIELEEDIDAVPDELFVVPDLYINDTRIEPISATVEKDNGNIMITQYADSTEEESFETLEFSVVIPYGNTIPRIQIGLTTEDREV